MLTESLLAISYVQRIDVLLFGKSVRTVQAGQRP